jgi:hypothetical protein
MIHGRREVLPTHPNIKLISFMKNFSCRMIDGRREVLLTHLKIKLTSCMKIFSCRMIDGREGSSPNSSQDKVNLLHEKIFMWDD